MQALVGIVVFVGILLLLFALRAVLGGKKTELDARLQREIGGRGRGGPSPFEDDEPEYRSHLDVLIETSACRTRFYTWRWRHDEPHGPRFLKHS